MSWCYFGLVSTVRFLAFTSSELHSLYKWEMSSITMQGEPNTELFIQLALTVIELYYLNFGGWKFSTAPCPTYILNTSYHVRSHVYEPLCFSGSLCTCLCYIVTLAGSKEHTRNAAACLWNLDSRLSAAKPLFNLSKLLKSVLCKKKIFHHIKFAIHAWSTKCRRNKKLIAQFALTLRDESFEPN